MINDFNIEGVFVPGLLVIALVALTCTLFLVHLSLSARVTAACPLDR